ncbi:MAG: FliM/FliN family flagellar motor switch protein [Hyphomicrobiaceae bacterium]
MNTSEQAGAGGQRDGRAPIVRLFERTRTRLVDMPEVQALMQGCATSCAAALRELSTLKATTALQSLEQVTIGTLRQRFPAALTVSGQIPAWNARGLVLLDPLFLFRVLDATYGGDAAARTTAPERPLTVLERSLAARAAMAIMAHVQTVLHEVAPFAFRAARCDDTALTEGADDAYVAICIRLAEFGDNVVVALPLAGLELARPHLGASERADEPDLDPSWSRDFRRSLLSASVAITAIVDGPDMTLSDVAKLRPGSIVELDEGALANVRLEACDKALFVGRLGQSRGLFTIQTERLGPTSREGEERSAPQ